MAEPGRAAKLSRLNSFRRECPFATQSAIEALLANIKKHGVPELSTRKNMKEATRAHLNQHKAYGELLFQVPVVLHNGGTTDVWLVNGLTMLAAAYSQGAWAAMLERVHGAQPSTHDSPWLLARKGNPGWFMEALWNCRIGQIMTKVLNQFFCNPVAALRMVCSFSTSLTHLETFDYTLEYQCFFRMEEQ